MTQDTVKKIHISKRIFDIVVSLLIVLLLSPLILLALLAIKVEHIVRGRPFDPFFYSETRYSYGETFTLYKFNIFKYEQVLQLRAQGHVVHTKELEHNNGITRVGWILKQIYMDELPQFFCVLKGELSIVGPRPVNPEVYGDCLKNNILDKNRVPGGITGNFQSHKETEGADAAALDKAYADVYHTKPWYTILAFDLAIIFRTLKVILLARGV